MSSPADQDSSVRPVKVRLLTFDWLPFTDDLSAGEAVYDAMDRLSADGTFFENHYLQKNGVRSITEGFSTSAEVDGVRGRVLIFGSGDLPVTDFSSLPDSLAAEFCGSTADASNLPDDNFCWLHFEPEESASAMELESALPLIDSLLEQQCVVIVASVFGKAQPYGRFESLLAEGLIRAPLWMLGTGADCGRIQVVTGSCDVAYTIQRLLQPGGIDAAQPSPNEPADLTAFCSGPGQRLQREVLIEHDCMKAVRSSEFLLVHCPPSLDTGPSESRTALYAKPEDVWNLNDVAGEYQGVVDALNLRLDSGFAVRSTLPDSAAPHD